MDVVLGAMEGVDRGGLLLSDVPLVNATPLTTRGGVVLGVILMGVDVYDEPVPRL